MGNTGGKSVPVKTSKQKKSLKARVKGLVTRKKEKTKVTQVDLERIREQEKRQKEAAAAKPAESSAFQDSRDHVVAEERPLHNLSRITHFDVPTLRFLKAIFDDISGSQVADGIIDSDELAEAMGLNPSSLLGNTLFRLFDVTQTKRINFRTWVTTLSALSDKATLEDKIRLSFSLYDLNSDGTIDKQELHDLLLAAVRDNTVVSLTPQQCEEVVAHTLEHVDKDQNGTVDYFEYRDMVSQSPKFLEAFSLNVPRMCAALRRVRSSKYSLHLHEDEAKRQREKFRERVEHDEAISDSREDDNEMMNVPGTVPPFTRKKTHAPSEKELDLDARVVDTRRLSELFDAAELQAAVDAVQGDFPLVDPPPRQRATAGSESLLRSHPVS